jgi:hypothetical protein
LESQRRQLASGVRNRYNTGVVTLLKASLFLTLGWGCACETVTVHIIYLFCTFESLKFTKAIDIIWFGYCDGFERVSLRFTLMRGWRLDRWQRGSNLLVRRGAGLVGVTSGVPTLLLARTRGLKVCVSAPCLFFPPPTRPTGTVESMSRGRLKQRF